MTEREQSSRGHGSLVTLHERAYREIRDAIVSGRLEPGQRLIEATTAAQLGVSRASAREAIRRLAQDGLVTLSPHRGATVCDPGLDDLDDVYTIRGALEGLAARLAARRRTARQLQQLRRVLQRMSRAVERGDSTETVLADVEFHRLVILSAGNRRLEEIATALLDPIRRIRVAALRGPEWSAISLEQHGAILAAIEARDDELAATLSSAHIGRARERILALSSEVAVSQDGLEVAPSLQKR